MVPPRDLRLFFNQDFSCPDLLFEQLLVNTFNVRGYHPLRPCFPDRFRLSLMYHWPGPRSLATTNGVSVDVLSSRYLDVSVPWVRLKPPILFGDFIPSLDNWKSKTSRLGLKHCCSNPKIRDLGVPAIEGGFPHSEIRGSKLLRSSPRLIAA